MSDLTCPKCKAPLSKEEIKTKCKSSIHLYEVVGSDGEAPPKTVIVQCPNGDLVEVECSEADQSDA